MRILELRTWRRPRVSGALLLVTALIGAVVTTIVLTAGGSGAVVSGSPSGFESNDGNMLVDGSPAADWNCFANGAVSQFNSGGTNTGGTCSPALVPTNAVAMHPDANNGSNGEVTWKAGQKLDASCPTLSNNGSVPNKDDFTGIASYNEVDQSHNTYLYGAEIRQVANGNSSGNVELNQVQGPVTGCSSAIARTAGDRLLAFDFLNGGTNLDFHALTWITTDNPTIGGNNGTCDIAHDSLPCWGANVISATSGITVGGCNTTGNDVEGCSNQSAISANDNGKSDNGIDGSALAANQFAEFGVNLTKVLKLPQCASFPQEVWESRSSGSSFTSNPEDIEIEHHVISLCGSITVIKHTNPRGENQAFSYSTTGGLTPSTFDLNDSCGAATGSPGSCTGNTKTYSNVFAGQYTVTESSTDPSGYNFDSVSCKDNNVDATASQASISGRTVTINLAANDNFVCTYVNDALGTINIIKNTDARNIDQNFGFTSDLTTGSASTGSVGAFTLNDGTHATNPNEQTITNVPAGTYHVTEGAEPSGWTLESLSCTPSSGSSFGVQETSTPPKADITVAAGGTVTCTYTNKQPFGAIQITKESTKGATPLSGANFEICTQDPTSNTCVAPSGSVPSTNPITTGQGGTACMTNVPWFGTGTTYYVKETSVPAGFSLNSTVYPVTVSVDSAACTGTGAAPATQLVTDTPLTDLQVTVTSESSIGGTDSKITCVDSASSPNTVASSGTGNVNPASASVTGLVPGTYTCTVLIDP